MTSSKNRFSNSWKLFKKAAIDWLDDKVPMMGSSLAFYSILSIGPLLVIIISIAGLVFDKDTASQHIIDSMGGLVGEQGAIAIKDILANSKHESESIITAIIGMVTLIFGAAGVFGQLQDSLI